MSDPEVHIVAWEAAGLIDAPLAARLGGLAAAWPGGLRSGDRPVRPASAGPAPGIVSPTSAGSVFGPIVTIGEVFAYVGTAFILGAWVAFIGSFASSSDREAILTAGLTVAALVMFGLGVFLSRGDQRRRRGAGVAFLATIFLAAGAAEFLVQMDFLRNTLQFQAPAVLIALIAAAVAAGVRRLLPAVSTQAGVIVTLAGLAGALLGWLQSIGLPHGCGLFGCVLQPVQTAEPVGLLVAGAAWWLLTALGVGLLGILEARHAECGPRGLAPGGPDPLWGRPDRGWRSCQCPDPERIHRQRQLTGVCSSRGSPTSPSWPWGSCWSSEPFRPEFDCLHPRRSDRPDHRPDRLQLQLPGVVHLHRPADRRRDPPRRRLRRGSAPTAPQPKAEEASGQIAKAIEHIASVRALIALRPRPGVLNISGQPKNAESEGRYASPPTARSTSRIVCWH